MDKNNDIQVNKVSKWEAAPVSIKNLRNYISESWVSYAAPPCCPPLDPSCQDSICESMMILLESVLDDYNELEAKYQEACGMISEYEEENKELKSELDIKTDECDALISRVFKQDEEYTKLEAEHKKLQETHELCMKAHLRLCDDSTKLATENDDLRQERDKYSYRLEKLGQALEERGIYCRWFEVSLEWHLYEGESFEELNRKIQRLEKESKGLKEHYEEELRIREKEKDEKDKLIEELNQKIKDLELKNSKNNDIPYGYFNLISSLRAGIEALEKENKELKDTLAKDDKDKLIDKLTHENMVLKLKNYNNGTYGLTGKIEELKKENKELKDTLAKDREFGKYVGKLVADSIQEGWKNGAYELHPYTRFDIRVEETNNMSTTFDRYSIPNVVVAFNNTQTEMERDTAQHECEELNRKIKELEKEKIDLKTTLALCERDANMARELCHTVAFNAERARNNKE